MKRLRVKSKVLPKKGFLSGTNRGSISLFWNYLAKEKKSPLYSSKSQCKRIQRQTRKVQSMKLKCLTFSLSEKFWHLSLCFYSKLEWNQTFFWVSWIIKWSKYNWDSKISWQIDFNLVYFNHFHIFSWYLINADLYVNVGDFWKWLHGCWNNYINYFPNCKGQLLLVKVEISFFLWWISVFICGFLHQNV